MSGNTVSSDNVNVALASLSSSPMFSSGRVRALRQLSQKVIWLSCVSNGSSRLKSTRWTAMLSFAAK